MASRTVHNFDVNGFNTEIYTRDMGTSDEMLFIVIPGNPGIVEFYIEFVDQLSAMMNYTTVAVSHAGHISTHLFDNHEIYSLFDQLEHKEAFIDLLIDGKIDGFRNVNKDTKIVLIGHSIGCYLCLRLKKVFPHVVVGVVNLMPTIRNLYDGLATHIKIAIMPGVRSLLGYTVKFIPDRLVSHFVENGLHSHVTSEVLQMLRAKVNPWLVWNIFYMAYTEADEVINIDAEILEVIDNFPDELIFLYSPVDNYTPASFISDLISSSPSDITVHVLEDQAIEHAFVLTHSKDIASIVTRLLIPKISEY